MSALFGKGPVGLGVDYPTAPGLGTIIGAPYRRRQSWNDRLQHWEKPATVTEEGTIERAQTNVVSALAKNEWLVGQRVKVEPQGSYHNNTNVRTEADVDLRVQHPTLRVDYAPGISVPHADYICGYSLTGNNNYELLAMMRQKVSASLVAQFGNEHVDTSGGKAIKISGITGSRAEIDVVPALTYHNLRWNARLQIYETLQGVAILGRDGTWTLNFPEQHHRNGIAKRTRTAGRFKRVVRVFKRMRADMSKRGILKINIPSFLIECMIYQVADEHFLVESDDRYQRVNRVAAEMVRLLHNGLATLQLTEINGIKPLFGGNQAWSLADAQEFATTAYAHLGDL